MFRSNQYSDATWIFIGRTDAETEIPILWAPDAKRKLTHLKKPWCWERLKAWGEGDDRGWGGWMSSLTQWTWVWINSRSWWWTGRPGLLHSMVLRRVRHDWATQLSWTELNSKGNRDCSLKRTASWKKHQLGNRRTRSWSLILSFINSVCYSVKDI